jgi:ADP-heptose:LPS heptosyltransferase
MVSAHVAELFKLTPWVDAVLGYPRVPRRPGLLGNLAWIRRLRRGRYDLVINTTGSDRSALLTGASGARARFGRRPPGGGRFWWKWMFTRVLEHPFWNAPMYRQKLAVFAQAGFASEAPPRFEIRLDAELRRRAGIPPERHRRYLHLSPCAGHSRKELPIDQLARLCQSLQELRPDLGLVLSCADLPRERARMDALLAALPAPPWKCFAGTLDIPQLAAVIQGAALHLCGDSGSLHLAVMTGTPAVAWLRQHANLKEWMPEGPRYRTFVAPDGPDDRQLAGIDNALLIDATRALLQDTRA